MNGIYIYERAHECLCMACNTTTQVYIYTCYIYVYITINPLARVRIAHHTMYISWRRKTVNRTNGTRNGRLYAHSHPREHVCVCAVCDACCLAVGFVYLSRCRNDSERLIIATGSTIWLLWLLLYRLHATVLRGCVLIRAAAATEASHGNMLCSRRAHSFRNVHIDVYVCVCTCACRVSVWIVCCSVAFTLMHRCASRQSRNWRRRTKRMNERKKNNKWNWIV